MKSVEKYLIQINFIWITPRILEVSSSLPLQWDNNDVKTPTWVKNKKTPRQIIYST